jgi:hypothetical protein
MSLLNSTTAEITKKKISYYHTTVASGPRRAAGCTLRTIRSLTPLHPAAPGDQLPRSYVHVGIVTGSDYCATRGGRGGRGL